MENSKLKPQEILMQKLGHLCRNRSGLFSMGSLTNTAVPIDLSLKAV